MGIVGKAVSDQVMKSLVHVEDVWSFAAFDIGEIACATKEPVGPASHLVGADDLEEGHAERVDVRPLGAAIRKLWRLERRIAIVGSRHVSESRLSQITEVDLDVIEVVGIRSDHKVVVVLEIAVEVVVLVEEREALGHLDQDVKSMFLEEDVSSSSTVLDEEGIEAEAKTIRDEDEVPSRAPVDDLLLKGKELESEDARSDVVDLVVSLLEKRLELDESICLISSKFDHGLEPFIDAIQEPRQLVHFPLAVVSVVPEVSLSGLLQLLEDLCGSVSELLFVLLSVFEENLPHGVLDDDERVDV